ncbi:B-box zinc finger protein 22 [Nymphaea thermarum]|nr:B-box zinc finger protein 22 [Nymphaea thermarum]
MKITCNSCEVAEVVVMCCADEAALCSGCDEKIHAANKLAEKHQRIPLMSASQMPKCDICQDAIGYFFCVEDRALLCRKCDVAIHTANAYVSGHQRFLITGVRVGLETTPVVINPDPADRVPAPPPKCPAPSLSKKPTPAEAQTTATAPAAATIVTAASSVEPFPVQNCIHDNAGTTGKAQFPGTPFTGLLPNWGLDDFLSLPDFDQNFVFVDNGSSKMGAVKSVQVKSPSDPDSTHYVYTNLLLLEGDPSKYGECDWSPIYHAADEELSVEECTFQVPEMPSPPTDSGLYWPANFPAARSYADDSFFVPDITSSSSPSLLQQPFYQVHHGGLLTGKRRRHV